MPVNPKAKKRLTAEGAEVRRAEAFDDEIGCPSNLIAMKFPLRASKDSNGSSSAVLCALRGEIFFASRLIESHYNDIPATLFKKSKLLFLCAPLRSRR